MFFNMLKTFNFFSEYSCRYDSYTEKKIIRRLFSEDVCMCVFVALNDLRDLQQYLQYG